MSNITTEIILISDVHNIKTSIFIDKKISICYIYDIFTKTYNIPEDTFFLVCNGKLVSKWNCIFPVQEVSFDSPYVIKDDKIIIELIPKMVGGIFDDIFGGGGLDFGDILDQVQDLIDDAIDNIKNFFMDIINTILNGLMYIFNNINEYVIQPLTNVFESFKNVIISIGKFIIYFGKLFVWFFKVIGWIFTELLNIPNFITDFVKAFMSLIYAIFSTVTNLIYITFETGVNGIGSLVVSSFWGWDQSNLSKDDKKSKYFKDIKDCKNKKCYLNQDNTVPFSVLLGTILCPPLGVFMEYGATGWFNILICAVLTLFFYFPGLFYALLIIYNT